MGFKKLEKSVVAQETLGHREVVPADPLEEAAGKWAGEAVEAITPLSIAVIRPFVLAAGGLVKV
jgi:hypothetical protein